MLAIHRRWYRNLAIMGSEGGFRPAILVHICFIRASREEHPVMAHPMDDRPAILFELSVSQMNEMQQQFSEGDREGFDRRASPYGWSEDQADQVWHWLSRPHVLLELTPVEIGDLRQHHMGGDRDAFETQAQEHGWTTEEADEAWDWFNRQPTPPRDDLEAASP
jgi:hypothetical protein